MSHPGSEGGAYGVFHSVRVGGLATVQDCRGGEETVREASFSTSIGPGRSRHGEADPPHPNNKEHFARRVERDDNWKSS